MKFVRAIWKLLVGIKDALVLMFMLMFFGLLYVGLSAKPQPVGEGVLAFDLDGSVVEQPASATFAEVAGGASSLKEYRLRDLDCRARRGRTTTGSRRSRSTSTASSAAARRRCRDLPMRCAACALRASR